MNRYILAQSSALLVTLGIVAVLMWAVDDILRLLGIPSDHFPSWKHEVLLYVVIAIITVGGFGTLWLWGRVLVLFGVLSKEEAKGYPFSEPWKQDRRRADPLRPE